jgi:hypothetical protein
MQLSTHAGEPIDNDGISVHAANGVVNLIISSVPARHDTSLILSSDEGPSRP